MKKSIIVASTVLLIILILISNIYYQSIYDINLLEYFSKSGKLTEKENMWLKDHGDIIYGSDKNSPPLRFYDERSGQYRGIIVDYISALSLELKTEISFEPVDDWDEVINSETPNEKDFFDLMKSEERATRFDFSDPIYSLRGVVLTKKDSNITELSDLENLNIAVIKGDYAIEFLDNSGVNVNYKLNKDTKTAMMELEKGAVDGVIGDEPIIAYLLEELNLKDELKIISKPLYEIDGVLAVQKSEDVLLSILNKGIYNLKKKNVMKVIQQKWFGISNSFARDNTNEKIILLISSFISIIGIIVYISYSWSDTLKREVRKRTEELSKKTDELSKSKNDLQVTFDGLTHLMIVIDENFNIINMNRAFSELVGLSGWQIIGKKIDEFPGLLFGNDLEHTLKATFNTEKQIQEEFKYKSKLYEMSTFPLANNNVEDKSILIMIKDITNVRLSEQQLLQDNKMKAMGILAAGVAHEIRNPLGLIRNYTYVIKTNADNDIDRNNDALRVIEKSVIKASKIIDNMLNFSRISSNDYEDTNIREFVSDIIVLKKKMLKNRIIKFELVCHNSLNMPTKKESLKHIISNLLSNAIDAIENDGSIDVECEERDMELLIKIKDSGSGIEEEHLEMIFNPFFTTKPPGEGTGLGLYIVYNEVKKYGGSISVNSKVNKGTEFTISLPSC